MRMTKPLSTDEFRARLSDFLVAEPILGPVIGTFLITLNVGPWLGLFKAETLWPCLLAIGLGVATRINTAL